MNPFQHCPITSLATPLIENIQSGLSLSMASGQHHCS